MIKNFSAQVDDTETGSFLKEGPFQIGFSKAKGNLACFREQFPNLKFYGVKQTHSDTVIIYSDSSSSDTMEGDAIICQSPNVAIYVKSADCLPILCFDPVSGLIAAIHAGWRGVANQITKKTVSRMINEFKVKPENIQVYVGPHIQFSSFEVDQDVMLKLKTSVDNPSPEFFRQKQSKFFVNLEALIGEQLKELKVEKVWSLHQDTLTNLDYHSYRRGKSPSNRLISFITRSSHSLSQ